MELLCSVSCVIIICMNDIFLAGNMRREQKKVRCKMKREFTQPMAQSVGRLYNDLHVLFLTTDIGIYLRKCGNCGHLFGDEQ